MTFYGGSALRQKPPHLAQNGQSRSSIASFRRARLTGPGGFPTSCSLCFAKLDESVSFAPHGEHVARVAGVRLDLAPQAGDQRVQPRVGYTDPDLAAQLVDETNIDSLAVAIGNQHGYYKGKPHLDLDRLDQIQQKVNIPIILHGASGLSNAIIRESIKHGICKININTDLRYALCTSLKVGLGDLNQSYDIPKFMIPAIQAVEQTASEKMNLFGSTRRVSRNI